MTLYSFIKPGETKPEQFADRTVDDAVYSAAASIGLPLHPRYAPEVGPAIVTMKRGNYDALHIALEAMGFRFVEVEIVEVKGCS